MTIAHKKLFISIIFCTFFTFLFSENLVDYDFGYSLDIPEGYTIDDGTEDGRTYLLSHPNIPVTFVIKVSTEEKSSSSKILNSNLSKLKANFQIDETLWNDVNCAISSFSTKLDQKYSGWAVSAPLKNQNDYISLICYSPEEKFDQCQQFIMSTLNSLCIDFEKYNTPGIIVNYAFPKTGKEALTLNIAKTKIETWIDKSDCEASQFVVDLEYGVLLLYSNHNLWKEAWQRYYRMIYRDAYGRLETVSEDIYNTLFPLARKKNNQNKEITYAQYLLSWTQTFEYIRAEDRSSSDFTSLPRILSGVGSDCDSRSLLLCVLLKSINIESILLISPEYSHAMIVTEIEAPGQVYNLEGTDRNFIFGETTAKVTWGMIAQDFADQTKWIPVILP